SGRDVRTSSGPSRYRAAREARHVPDRPRSRPPRRPRQIFGPIRPVSAFGPAHPTQQPHPGRRPAGARPANLLRGGARYPSLLATIVAADRASLPPRGTIRDALPWLRGPTRWPEDGRTSGAIPPVGVSGNIRDGAAAGGRYRR